MTTLELDALRLAFENSGLVDAKKLAGLWVLWSTLGKITCPRISA